MSAGYGIKRLRSLLDFMDKEDWSERLPELQEWIHTVDRHRGLDFKQIFSEISGILD